MRVPLLAVVFLALTTACADRPRREALSPEQLAWVRKVLNPKYTIRRAYAVRSPHTSRSHTVTVFVYGPGLEQDLKMTWVIAGPKHAPEGGIIQSRVPISLKVLRWSEPPEQSDSAPEGLGR